VLGQGCRIARGSMAAKGTPYENAQAERFFQALKTGEVYLKRYETYDEARANIGPFIEEVYSTRRLHSALGYRPPRELEGGVAHLKFMR
jgi:putative transposase